MSEPELVSGFPEFTEAFMLPDQCALLKIYRTKWRIIIFIVTNILSYVRLATTIPYRVKM